MLTNYLKKLIIAIAKLGVVWHKSNAMQQNISLYDFSDYRSFLKAYAEDAKRQSRAFSLGGWSRKLGLKGTASLSMILNGQRQAGPALAEKFCRYFRFNAKERDYFQGLVQLSKSERDPQLTAILLERLAKHRGTKHFKELDLKTFEVISHWYYYALRELVATQGFREDENWISRRLYDRVTTRQIKQAIQTLLGLGLLSRDAEGRLQQASGTIDTVSGVASEALKRFHEQSIEIAHQSIRSVPVEKRDLNSTTLNILKKDLDKARLMIRDFQEQFCQSVETLNGEETYQLTIQFFPLSKSLGENLNPLKEGSNHA